MARSLAAVAGMSDPNWIEELRFPATLGGGFATVWLGLRWVAHFISGRLDKRQADLDAEHSALDMGWREYRKFLERDRLDLRNRLGVLEKESRAFRLSYDHVATALIRIDPLNPALERAGRILREAFPTDFDALVAQAEAALDKGEPQA